MSDLNLVNPPTLKHKDIKLRDADQVIPTINHSEYNIVATENSSFRTKVCKLIEHSNVNKTAPNLGVNAKLKIIIVDDDDLI